MSHQIRIKSKMTSKRLVEKALKAMGAADLKVSGDSITCDGMCFNKGRDGTYTMTGDPYYARGAMRKHYSSDRGMVEAVQEHYLIEEARENLAQAGFFLQDRTKKKNKNGQLVMQAHRM